MNNRIILVAVFALAAVAGLALFRSPAPPPAAPPEPGRLGIPVDVPDAAPGSPESLVVTAALPRGGFVAARLTDDLSALEAAYEEQLLAVVR